MYAILARSAPRAVIFRRSPSRRVLLVAWNTATDEFEIGQWLNGRIYERRCDLSPNGELLLYFAASFRNPLYSWTAVSRPPYLTAVALWPKGDCWGGGGHFETKNRIALNHRDTQMSLGDGFHLPKNVEVKPLGKGSGGGEDYPVWSLRLERDGWTWLGGGWPGSWEKRHPLAPDRHILQMNVRGMAEKNGAWYIIDHRVLTDGVETHALGRSDWADWSANGDLLYSKRMSIYRLPWSADALVPTSDARELIDLRDQTFVAREAPSFAHTWRNR